FLESVTETYPISEEWCSLSKCPSLSSVRAHTFIWHCPLFRCPIEVNPVQIFGQGSERILFGAPDSRQKTAWTLLFVSQFCSCTPLRFSGIHSALRHLPQYRVKLRVCRRLRLSLGRLPVCWRLRANMAALIGKVCQPGKASILIVRRGSKQHGRKCRTQEQDRSRGHRAYFLR